MAADLGRRKELEANRLGGSEKRGTRAVSVSRSRACVIFFGMVLIIWIISAGDSPRARRCWRLLGKQRKACHGEAEETGDAKLQTP